MIVIVDCLKLLTQLLTACMKQPECICASSLVSQELNSRRLDRSC